MVAWQASPQTHFASIIFQNFFSGGKPHQIPTKLQSNSNQNPPPFSKIFSPAQNQKLPLYINFILIYSDQLLWSFINNIPYLHFIILHYLNLSIFRRNFQRNFRGYFGIINKEPIQDRISPNELILKFSQKFLMHFNG